MFYCSDCAAKNDWPDLLLKRFGSCEKCGKQGPSNSIPDRLLPVTIEA